MATAESPKHLAQQELSENDKIVIEGLQNWLQNARFEYKNKDNFQVCVDDEMSGKILGLMNMELFTKVKLIH
ncbi:MAG: hypothetical protein M1814_000491 [Vezdaea aestivalis]|nr:MAG: hypothetical protein M1814_000491 [Vezdaea aestivalis]